MRGLGLLAALVLVAGCAGGGASVPEPAEASGSRLPPRPRDLTLTGVNPCSLLSEAQRDRLGLGGEGYESVAPSQLFGGPERSCLIRGYEPQAISVGLGLVTTTGVAALTAGHLDAAVVSVAVQGFPAVRVVPHRSTRYCSVFVDTAPDELIDIQVSDGGRQPPVGQDQLCQQAEEVAAASVQTLTGR